MTSGKAWTVYLETWPGGGRPAQAERMVRYLELPPAIGLHVGGACAGADDAGSLFVRIGVEAENPIQAAILATGLARTAAIAAGMADAEPWRTIEVADLDEAA